MKKDSVLRKVNNKYLWMPNSHQLPLYFSKFPLYDRALPRICAEVAKLDGHLIFIDVGANIGDTVALVTDTVSGKFLCIDGDKEYLPFLKINTSKIKGSKIYVEECYCSEGGTDNNYEIERFNGTAKLIKSKEQNGGIERFMSLDEILSKYSPFQKANVLKIDTDGFEVSVLRGAAGLLRDAAPLVYFEFVPELYLNNGHDPMYIFSFLIEKGYSEALFYDNFGVPVEIINMKNKKRIKELIDKIDNDRLYYFDILTWHHSKRKKYKKLFKDELKVKSLELAGSK